MLVAERFKVKIPRHFAKAFVADGFDMLLHEAIVIPPFDAGGTHGGLLGAGRDLMGVQIVQAELIDQRLLDFFVEDEKAIGLDRAATKFERPRHVPVDIDRLAVEAVAGRVSPPAARPRPARAPSSGSRHTIPAISASCAEPSGGKSRAASLKSMDCGERLMFGLHCRSVDPAACAGRPSDP